MADGNAYNPLNDPAFLNAPLPEKNAYLLANDPDFAKASPQDRMKYLQFVQYGPGHQLEDKAAASAPPVEGTLGVLGDFAKGALSTVTGPLKMLVNPESAIELGKQIGASPTPVRTAAETLIPGAKGAESLADLSARELGHAPLANESIGEAQKNVAQAAGQTAALAALPAAGKGAQSLADRITPTAAELAEKQASNLSSALEMGGASPRGVMTHEEIAKPILNDFRSEAANQGITKDQLAGRNGYAAAKSITSAVRAKYDNAYESLIDPIRDAPATGAAQNAAQSVISKMSSDASLLDELKSGGNMDDLQKLSQAVGNAKTIGQLDDLRIKLNQLLTKYEGKNESGQYGSPIFQSSLKAAADSIRSSLYPAIEEMYQGSIDENALRQMQQTHGAAIAADQMMGDAAQRISRYASEEAAPASLLQRIRGSSYRATMSPRHAVGGMIEKFFPPSVVGLFNTRIARAIEGATPGEAPSLEAPPSPPFAVPPSRQLPPGPAGIEMGLQNGHPVDVIGVRGETQAPQDIENSLYREHEPGGVSPNVPERIGYRIYRGSQTGEPNENIPSSPGANAPNASSPSAEVASRQVGPTSVGPETAASQPANGAANAPAQPVRDNAVNEERVLSVNSAKAKGWASKASDQTKIDVIGAVQDAVDSGAGMADIFNQFGASIMRQIGKDAGIPDPELNGMIKGDGLTHQGQVHLGQILRSWLEKGKS